MGTKERLLQFLEQHSGEFTSGEALAQQLQVSRTAIWKAINALRASGYKIQATQNRGYRLDEQQMSMVDNAIAVSFGLHGNGTM